MTRDREDKIHPGSNKENQQENPSLKADDSQRLGVSLVKKNQGELPVKDLLPKKSTSEKLEARKKLRTRLTMVIGLVTFLFLIGCLVSLRVNLALIARSFFIHGGTIQNMKESKVEDQSDLKEEMDTLQSGQGGTGEPPEMGSEQTEPKEPDPNPTFTPILEPLLNTKDDGVEKSTELFKVPKETFVDIYYFLSLVWILYILIIVPDEMVKIKKDEKIEQVIIDIGNWKGELQGIIVKLLEAFPEQKLTELQKGMETRLKELKEFYEKKKPEEEKRNDQKYNWK